MNSIARAGAAGEREFTLTPGRLSSWKEIAAYLDREVRTAQRWERCEGLPIHRLVHGKGGSVYAFKTELDLWVKRRTRVIERRSYLRHRVDSLVRALSRQLLMFVLARRHEVKRDRSAG